MVPFFKVRLFGWLFVVFCLVLFVFCFGCADVQGLLRESGSRSAEAGAAQEDQVQTCLFVCLLFVLTVQKTKECCGCSGACGAAREQRHAARGVSDHADAAHLSLSAGVIGDLQTHAGRLARQEDPQGNTKWFCCCCVVMLFCTDGD
jgi:hypothetical protein